VLLAYRPDAKAVGLASAPRVLGSAQGIWAASLVDAGVLGLLAWTMVFGAVFYYTGSVAIKAQSRLLWASLVAALVSVLASQVGGDRIDLRVWVLIGLALAAARWARSDDRRSESTARGDL
jgi:hypothetical protein